MRNGGNMPKETPNRVMETDVRFETDKPGKRKKKRRTRRTRPGKVIALSEWDLSTAARKVSTGLPPGILNDVQVKLGLSNRQLSILLHISSRTLTRRRTEDRLPPDESERVYRVARLAEIAVSVLGSEDHARAWLKKPSYSLGDQVPLDLARTEPGAALVERALRQIQYGITV